MSNLYDFKNILDEYLQKNGISFNMISDLYHTSINDANQANPYQVYKNRKNLVVIDMDKIAKEGYKVIKKAKGSDSIVNTVDAFLINKDNEWFFIEFKDETLNAKNSRLKNGIIKKAYSNWYMLLDILYDMNTSNKSYAKFDFDHPVKFAKEHIHYILVCSDRKNPQVVQQIKNHEKIGEKYTPPFMQRLKIYLFKDVYVYTETYLERKFVRGFMY